MQNERQIDIQEFIAQLDACFNRNDMRGARECIERWEQEARAISDRRGLLTVLNEAVGFYRRSKKKGKATAAMEESLALVEELDIQETRSGATILINSATTQAFFGKQEEGLSLYKKAASYYEGSGQTESYEYATLLNNSAGILYELHRYEEAEENWRKAIGVLEQLGHHDGDIAVSLVMLAHLINGRKDNAQEKIEQLLDEAWGHINSYDQPRDGNYAYVLRKCAPSFEYFERPVEAQALRDVANEIYGKAREELMETESGAEEKSND